MDGHSTTFGQVATQALTDAAASHKQSTKGSNGSDDEHKRYFLQTFRRWEILFKRKDGNVEADKWLIAEYYKSLMHLSAAGLDRLTDVLKENCTFFPTIKECLDATRCGRYDWGHPFLSLQSEGTDSPLLRGPVPRPLGIAAPARQIGHDDD